MDFSEDENAEALRDLLRRFLDKEVPPQLAARWDQEDRIPRENLIRLAELGVCGLTVPEEYGGMGRDVLGMVTTIRELARRSVALAGLYIMNACYGSLNISESGTQEQKQRLLPGLCAGKVLFAYGLSEPDVGADLPSVKTRAERRGDTVIINGYKRWCSGAAIADYIYMLVRSGEPEARYKNLSLVLVPPGTPGVTLQSIGTMGMHGMPTNDVILEDVEVPFANVVGGEASWNQRLVAAGGADARGGEARSTGTRLGYCRSGGCRSLGIQPTAQAVRRPYLRHSVDSPHAGGRADQARRLPLDAGAGRVESAHGKAKCGRDVDGQTVCLR